MKSKTFEMDIDVVQAHLDENDHVNNVQYLQWIQDVAKAHWENEADPNWLNDFYWVALSHFIEYKKPAVLNDSLIIKTHIESFKGVKSERFVRIYNKTSGDLLCQCVTIWCMLDRTTNRPTRVTKEMEMAFEEE